MKELGLEEAIEWAKQAIKNSHSYHIEQNKESFRLVFEAVERKNFNAVKMTGLCVKALYEEQGEGTLLSAAIEKLDSRELRCFVSAICALVWLELNPEIPRMPSDTSEIERMEDMREAEERINKSQKQGGKE